MHVLIYQSLICIRAIVLTFFSSSSFFIQLHAQKKVLFCFKKTTFYFPKSRYLYLNMSECLNRNKMRCAWPLDVNTRASELMVCLLSLNLPLGPESFILLPPGPLVKQDCNFLDGEPGAVSRVLPLNRPLRWWIPGAPCCCGPKETFEVR